MSEAISGDSVLATAPGIIWREVAGEVVLLNPKEDVIMGLNVCGGETWKLLDGKRGLDAIADELATAFGQDSEQVAGDVLSFASVLVERGLATLVS